MAEELQSLLEKIQRNGIEKAAAERDEILKQARSEAAAVVAAARQESEDLRTAAAADAEALKKRAESAVRQAARDILLDLKSELKKRLEAVVRSRLDEALSAEFMAEVIKDVVSAAVNDTARADAGFEVMVSPAKCDALTRALAASIGADLVEKIAVFPNSAAGKGLKISTDGDAVFYDFSDSALSGMICEYAGSRVSAIISAEDN